jgi:hypothetical protein
MTERVWDGTASHARVKNAETKYCDECGHALDRHKRNNDKRLYVCNFHGCSCKLPKLKVHKVEKP